jgi:LAS superfamily LD-carboxypeptidase LdcB
MNRAERYKVLEMMQCNVEDMLADARRKSLEDNIHGALRVAKEATKLLEDLVKKSEKLNREEAAIIIRAASGL